MPADPGQRRLQPVEQQHPVGQAGERIVQRAVREVRLLELELGDVAGDPGDGR